MAITKPPVLPAWAESGDKVTPSNAEIQVGWPLSSIPPSRQRFNWLLNYLANAVRYFSRRGMPDYDAAETYKIGDRVIGDDGKTYRSLQDANTGNTPSSSTLWWERWGFTKTELNAEMYAHDYKDSVRVATTANLAALSGLLTVDGVVLNAGDRVLVKDQTTGSQNGIYLAASGGWTRALDADDGTKLTSGALVPVEAGTANADTVWMLTTDGAITIGATALTFALNAGGNKFVKKAGDTLLGALTLFGGDTGVTPAQFDATTKLATTEFVQKALGNFSGRYGANTTQTLTAANAAGKVVNSNGTGLVLTLPLSTAVPAGTVICFENDGNDLSIARQGTDLISTSSSNSTSITLKAGDTLLMESNALGTWRVIGGSGQVLYSNLFGSSLAGNGYKYIPDKNSPSGFWIVQWADGTNVAAAGNQTITLPIAFPNANLKTFVTNIYASSAQNGGYGFISSTTSQVVVARNNADNGNGVAPRVLSIGY